MRVDELDYFAFSYLNMTISEFCEYVESPANIIKGQLKITHEDAVSVLKVKNSNTTILQEYRTKSDIAYIYQYSKPWIVFISNSRDGWSSLAWAISKNVNIAGYSFKLDRGKCIENCINSFIFNNGVRVEERVVQTLIDNGKWVFYENGPLQKFESPENYRRRKIKDRLDYNILCEYCKKLGVNIVDDNFLYPRTESIIFERTYSKNWPS
ncbi:MAG: hypothetical protein DELT_02604 [Desulfovibrio sp.]